MEGEVVLPRRDVCAGCGEDCSTVAGLKRHNVLAADTGERSYTWRR